MMTQAQALESAARQFRSYEASHRAKETPEADAKAAANKQMAEMCEEVLSGRPFQNRVDAWVIACFGDKIRGDKAERNHRFLEESLELVQACGGTADDAHQLVDYVFGRAVGNKTQEVGGVMMTLAALCNIQEVSIGVAAEAELARCWENIEKIRDKQAAKPAMSPLPQ